MFWKKNKLKGKGVLFNSPPDSRRAFRVSPSSRDPMRFQVGHQDVPVLNISSGGASFQGEGFQVGSRYPVRFQLPTGAPPIDAKVEILEVGPDQKVRCKFCGLTEEQENLIHQYVLYRQKEDLAAQKGRHV